MYNVYADLIFHRDYKQASPFTQDINYTLESPCKSCKIQRAHDQHPVNPLTPNTCVKQQILLSCPILFL